MAGEYAPTGQMGGQDVLDVDGAFEQIIQNEYDSTFNLAAAEARTDQVPFGLFTEAGGIDRLQENMRRAMATSTGYTGNNAEESA